MAFKDLAILVIFTAFIFSLSGPAYAACASGHGCSVVTVFNTTCFDNNPFDCRYMGGITYCYVQNATCSSDTPCYDPVGTEGAHCHCTEGAKTCSSTPVKKVCSNNTWNSTTCATNYKCSGGDCINCTPSTTYTCSSNDVYKNVSYPNSICGSNSSALYQDCGNTTYGSNFCSGNNVVRYKYSKGCSSGSCTSGTTTETVQTCSSGYVCSNASCVQDCSNVTASTACYDSDVYYYDNCGARQAKKTECGTSYDEPNFCSASNVVGKIHHDKGCSGTQCYDSPSSILVRTCDTGQICSSGSCQTSFQIVGYSLSPSSPTVGIGQSFTINYQIANSTSSSQTATLGASLYMQNDLSNTEYTNSSGDKQVTISTGTNWYSRTFMIPLNAPNGSYKAVLGLWKVPFTERLAENYDPGIYGYVISVNSCTNGATRCASDTVKETCVSGQWSSQSMAYCYFNGTSATQVECLNNSHCSGGKTCNTGNHTCQLSCTPGAATGSKRCGANLSTVEEEYYLSDCSKAWRTAKTCFTDPTTALQYCSDFPFQPDCAIRLIEGSACSPPASSIMSCASGICKPDSTCGCIYNQKKCASAAVAQTCNNLGEWASTACGANQTCSNGACADNAVCTNGATRCPSETVKDTCVGGQWSSQSMAYCYFNGTSAVQVQCIRNEHCPSGQACQNNACVIPPCSLSSAAWSKTTAFQWDSVQMSVNAPGCEGKTVTFTIKEDDGMFGADYVQQGTAVVSNGKASLGWTAAYIEDQYANPEFYFIAETEGKTSKSGEMKVYAGSETQKFSQLSAIAASGPFKIITYDSPSAYAAGYIDTLRGRLVAKNGNSSSFSQNSVANCWDYQKLNSNLVLIGAKATNKVISCLSSSDRAQALTGSQIEIIENPWASGKYIIVVQASDAYIDGIAALAIMIDKGANPEWKKRDYIIGCITAGSENNFGTEVACNIIPIVELVYDWRDSFNCIKTDNLRWVDPNALDSQTLVDKIICDVTYAISAFDVVSTVGMFASFGLSEIPAEGIDAVLSTLKVSFRKAAALATKETLVDVTKMLDGMSLAKKAATLKSLGNLLRNVPSVTDDVIKASLKLLSNGPEVAEKSFTFLNKRAGVLKGMDSAKAIEGVAYIFKAEKETGIKMVIDASDSYAKNALSMAADDSLFLRLKAVSENLGIPYGNIKEVRFVDSVPNGGDALGFFDEAGQTMYLRSRDLSGISPTKFVDIQRYNTIIHEATHSKFAKELGDPNSASALQTEEYMVDRLIRRDFSGDDLLKYKDAEAFQMDRVDAGYIGDIIAGAGAREADGLAEAAALYAKADAYDGFRYVGNSGETLTLSAQSVKGAVEAGIRDAAAAKGLSASQAESAFAAFRKYADEMGAAGDKYIDAHGFFPPADISLTGASVRATSTEIGSVSKFSTGAEEAVLATSSSSGQTATIMVPKGATVTSAAVRISGDAQ